jgi:hypothetical protein
MEKNWLSISKCMAADRVRANKKKMFRNVSELVAANLFRERERQVTENGEKKSNVNFC